MIIISSKGLPKIEHKTAAGNVVTFGPVFNATFMLKVFNLQKRILGEILFCERYLLKPLIY